MRITSIAGTTLILASAAFAFTPVMGSFTLAHAEEAVTEQKKDAAADCKCGEGKCEKCGEGKCECKEGKCEKCAKGDKAKCEKCEHHGHGKKHGKKKKAE